MLTTRRRDAIMKEFGLSARSFSESIEREEPERSDGKLEIIYKVLRNSVGDANVDRECLGYILFKEVKDGGGSIELTNRRTTLQPWHLDLGATSKANDAQQAGAHGEGLKLAVLTLMRGPQNHSVRCRSGGFGWTFNFTNQGRLVVRLKRMAPEAIDARRSSSRTLGPFAANPTRDVQFVIGEKPSGRNEGRNEHGENVSRRLVRREDFEKWTEAALFLHKWPETAILTTPVGDLLTDPRLRGRIYLKGLLLHESTDRRSASITNRPLRFGYNFAHGKTNRERQSVADAVEEGMAILLIWKMVVANRPEMLSELSDMLNATDPEYADVAWVVWGRGRVDKETASRLRGYLLGDQHEGKWYYCAEDKNKVPSAHFYLPTLCQARCPPFVCRFIH